MIDETTTATTTAEVAPKTTRKAKTMTVKNAHAGKFILNGKILQVGEQLILDAKYLADKKKMNIVNRSIKFGYLVKA